MVTLHRAPYLVPVMTRLFSDLHVGASLFRIGHWPVVVHDPPSVLALEVVHGAVADRQAYTAECFQRARDEGETVLARHSGFADLFVPVNVKEQSRPVIVTGPFATARPTSAQILERWRSMTGRQGRPDDPEFVAFVEVTLDTLTLDAEELRSYRRWLELYAALLAGAHAPAAELDRLENTLDNVRSVERADAATREMLDPRTSRIWSSPASAARLKSLGLAGFPDAVGVALLERLRGDSDPAGDLVLRDRFQRTAAGVARRVGNASCGRIAGHGLAFVVGPCGSADRTRRRLLSVMEKAAAGARELGLRLHLGTTERSASLPEQYQDALAAAQNALSRGVAIVRAETVAPRTVSLAREVRKLAMLVESDPPALAREFERYRQAVIARTGSLLEPTRGHLDVAFDTMIDALQETSALGPRALATLERSVKTDASHATTVEELSAVYRKALGDLVGAQLDPTGATRRRSMRRALEHMRRHFAEPLSLKRVATVSGFAPNYFSELFRKEMGTTFGQHLALLRVERAKELLADTPLTFARVARLSGLSTPQYLSRVFKRITGETPRACRVRGERRRRPQGWSQTR